MTSTPTPARQASRLNRGAPRGIKLLAVASAAVVVVLVLTVGSTYVKDGSKLTQGTQVFSPSAFADKNFAKVQQRMIAKAVPAATLAAALRKGQAAATKKYGVEVSGAPGPEFTVSFTGTVGKGEAGIYPVAIAGMPKELLVRVQTGPAINGTDLRDATGMYSFGQFTNQIEFQNAASALNQRLKQDVLAKIDTTALAGKTITVVGAFQLINPDGWLVTPATVSLR